jgi:hypothetical protein
MFCTHHISGVLGLPVREPRLDHAEVHPSSTYSMWYLGRYLNIAPFSHKQSQAQKPRQPKLGLIFIFPAVILPFALGF